MHERDYGADGDARDDSPQGPLFIEPLSHRGRRARYGLPVAVVVFIVAAFVVATVSHVVSYFTPAGASPAPPTPISWVDTTVAPTATPMPTPAPSYLPGQATPTPMARTSLAATIAISDVVWVRGEDNHFTLTLTNRTEAPVSLDPCPTYRIYFVEDGPASAPERVLNCSAIGSILWAGQSVDLDMVFTPTAADTAGSKTVVWELASPGNIQAIALAETRIHIVN